jgi:hypothetical protein
MERRGGQEGEEYQQKGKEATETLFTEAQFLLDANIRRYTEDAL